MYSAAMFSVLSASAFVSFGVESACTELEAARAYVIALENFMFWLCMKEEVVEWVVGRAQVV